jgi:predicted metal-dependent phosphoesterase TrpH
VSVDLHVHTCASDGTQTPADVVRAALELGLTAIAIADHDSVDGVPAALDAASGTTLTVVPGVELSCRFADNDIHMLGYLIDHRSERLLALLRSLRDRRVARAQAMVDALVQAGYTITLEGVLEHADGGTVGRSHIARALVSAGDIDSVEDAFSRLIGRRGPFFIEKELLSGEDAIAIVHESGGVAVIAHPIVTDSEHVLEPLCAAGLDGIEAFHTEHAPADRDRLAAFAARRGLVVTGGSDYHGPEAKGGRLGEGGCPDGALEDLRRRAAAIRD